MRFQFKPIEKQIVVLTGASGGIGLSTALQLAQRGASVILVSRNQEALEAVALECVARGGRALAVAADVGYAHEVERVARLAVEHFGGFDTWINNAGVAIFGGVEEVDLADQRRLFDTNYWGVVHGSIIAAGHLRERGGKIINIGSVLSDRSVILQGPYRASKHAVKAFTDTLRMELEESGEPISVSLVKPSAIDAPYMEHARNYLSSDGTKNPPPSYDPRVVAKAVVYACEHDKRDLVVGFGGWAVAALGAVVPRLTDFIMEAVGRALQESGDRGRAPMRDNLYQARADGTERSSLSGGRLRTSLFLEAQMRPATTALALAGLAVIAGVMVMRRQSGGQRSPSA